MHFYNYLIVRIFARIVFLRCTIKKNELSLR